MDIKHVVLELNKIGKSGLVLNHSLWSQHNDESEKIIKISRLFNDEGENVDLNETAVNVLNDYFINEERYYQQFIEYLLRLLPEILNEYSVDLPEEMTHQFIKDHIDLIGIKLDENDGETFLEFDFAPSWDDEHGLIALVHKEKILGFAEGGYCWAYNINGGDGYWHLSASNSIDENVVKEQDELIFAQAAKLGQFKTSLSDYKTLKSQRNTENALTKEDFLEYKTTHISEIDTKLTDCLYGDLFGDYIYVKGDLELEELDLDALQNEADASGVIVEGNLTVHGGICNFEGDLGPSLIVTGTTTSDYLIGGGSEIHLLGKAFIYGFIIGHYNHGIINVNETTTLVEINDDHHSEVSGDIVYNFKSSGFLGEHFYTELAKVYGQEATFTSKDYDDEDGKFEYQFDTYGFSVEFVNNGDISYLEKIGSHFSDRLELYKKIARASKEGNHELVKEVEIELENYVESYKESDEIGDYFDNNYVDSDYLDDGSIDTDYDNLNFKMYDLSGLDKLNLEIAESDFFGGSKLIFFKLFFSKKLMSEFGVIITKIEKMVGSTDFSTVSITNKKESLNELGSFMSVIRPMHNKRVLNSFLSIVAFVCGLWFFPESIVLYILIAFGLFSLMKKVYACRKAKHWLTHAENFIVNTTEKVNDNALTEQGVDDKKFDDALVFSDFVSKQDQEDWMVKVFDWFAQLIKGK